MRKITTALSALVISCGAASVASASTLYHTSFEAPEGFVAGTSPHGVDGWVNASGTGTGFLVTDLRAATGNQSLMSDNQNNVSFYSVRHDLGGYDASMGPLIVSTQLYMDSAVTQDNRIYGLYLGSSETSTLGGTVQGLTIDGAGRIRGGTTWSSTYTAGGQWAQASPNTYMDRWLNLTLEYDPATGAKTTTISGFADGSVYSNTFFGGAAPANLNLGTDYFATVDRGGVAFFDNVTVLIPEPSSLALLGLAGLAGLRRRR